MNAGYISAIHLCNSNLEIRIAGSSCCPQFHNASFVHLHRHSTITTQTPLVSHVQNVEMSDDQLQ